MMDDNLSVWVLGELHAYLITQPRRVWQGKLLQEHSDPSATAVISSSLPCLLRRRAQCHDTLGSCAFATKPPYQTPPRCLTCSRDRSIPAPAHLQDHSQFEKMRENFAKEIEIAIVDVISYQVGPYPSQ
ncbi:uncharacterized protein [Miscanthus floridulus]|uniref:uncharacterized protein n=1 Tax=Miscanthus floridulus TaxID=154761 RepID=UPI0034598D0D